MKNKKVYLPALFLGAALVALAGCHKEPGEVVKQRAIERWDALVNHHAVKAYEYLSPGYRSTHSLEQYVAFVATAKLQWKSASVDELQCEAEVCTVKLTVHSVIPGAVIHAPRDIQHEAPVSEKWVLSEGQWYFLPDVKVGGLADDANQGSGGSVPPAPDANPPTK